MIKQIHEECPNENHCSKNEEKCCYLVNYRCLIRETRQKGEQKT